MGIPIAYPSFMSVPDDPKIKELAERRIAVKQALVDALFNYLTFEDRVTLETFGTHKPYEPTYTVEHLTQAQEECEALIARIAQVEESLDTMPEGYAAMVDATLIAPMRQSLEWQQKNVSNIQAVIERQEKEKGAS